MAFARTGTGTPRRVPRWLVVVAVLALLVLGARASIDPLARHFTQSGLDKMEGFEGSFTDVSLSVFAFTYTIEGLSIVEKLPDGRRPEVLHVEKARSRVLWRNLLHGTIIGMARLEGARVRVVIAPGEEPKEVEAERAIEEPPKPWELDEAIQEVVPFKLERIEVLDGDLTIVDGSREPPPELRFPHLEAAIENFTTRRALAEGQPMTVALRCGLQQSGDLQLFLTVDPLADELTFAGEARLKGLQVREVRDYVIAATGGLELPQGEFDCYASFQCKDGHLQGGVKPLLKNAEIEAADDDLGTKLKALLADAGIALFSDRVPDRGAAAAVVPIDGHVTGPDVELWPTIFSLLRNAFVVGLSESFRGLPPQEEVKK